eukprot:7613706-Alexandrium_andersonii.AAC.1
MASGRFGLGQRLAISRLRKGVLRRAWRSRHAGPSGDSAVRLGLWMSWHLLHVALFRSQCTAEAQGAHLSHYNAGFAVSHRRCSARVSGRRGMFFSRSGASWPLQGCRRLARAILLCLLVYGLVLCARARR